MIYMNETARHSLMNFRDSVINIDLEFYIYINLVHLETFSPSFVKIKLICCIISRGEKWTKELMN